MSLRGWMLLLLLGLVSCRSLTPPDLAALDRVQAAVEGAQPMAFEARQSLVLEFRPHWWWPTVRMTTLGFAKVEPQTGDFAVVCLSPMGVKLFDVARTAGELKARIALPVPGDPEEIGRVIGEDISRLYFDLTPPPGAEVGRKGASLVFRSRQGEAWQEYEYDRLTTRLVRKSVYAPGRYSTVTYEDYQRTACGYYPITMRLVNRKNHYTLILRHLEIRPAR